MNRLDCIRSRLDRASSCLEFGPLDRPMIAPGTAGVRYADHAPNPELARKYATDPSVDVAAIPPIDFVIADNDLAPVERGGDRFDLVVAAHVFEHLPNPLRWLGQARGLLAPGGALFLVVPDRRFTFDAGRPATRLSDWIEALLEERSRPALRHVFEHFANARQVDAQQAWLSPVRIDAVPRLAGHGDAFGWHKSQVAAGGEAYIDTHCSVFSPTGLIGLFRGAARLGLFPFRVEGFWPTAEGDFEFAVLLAPLDPEPESEIPWPEIEALARRAGMTDGPVTPETVAARERDDHRFRARFRAAAAGHRPPDLDRHRFPDAGPDPAA